ncbi:C-type lectin domain family 12 member B [Labrus bergylta]|uniref:C-type lectin domain family 12 member B-like n=1 Tax=Labrus bergylta TaxID=56723 RepID=A0A3Q3E111_9LABR|nr:C-type lectin domain family 12 member B-like [Labrus bergylta]
MEEFKSQTEVDDNVLLRQTISRNFNHHEHAGSHHGLFGGGSCFALPHHRLVILSLGLLNAVLLIASVVLGIYCARASYFQVPVSAATPLIIEMNYLRNQSGIIRATLEARAAIAKKHTDHVQLKLELKQHKITMDRLQRQIKTLHDERENLQSNKSSLEDNCGRCLPGWRLLKLSCYYFSSRNESNPKKNWLDSRADCVSKGGELLVINNRQEQQLLSASFPTQSGSGEWWEKGFWIGLTHVATNGTWVWVNNVTELETIYWRSGQPKTDGPQSGNCAALSNLYDTTRMWYNGNCQDHQYNWICEKQPSPI